MAVLEYVIVRVAVNVGVPVIVGVSLGELDGVFVDEGVLVNVGVPDCVAVLVPLGVKVIVDDGETVLVSVGLALSVHVAVTVGESVGDGGVPVHVIVIEGVKVGLSTRVKVTVPL